ncbi:fatty acid hydroxylase [Rhodanobacter sp. FW510-R12]|uniref:sterol desaturase family protein n=1 Tax=unclassified Rhodanobacter TaxID=2621553 RepID=UPI0007AA38A2|nr:MULTISPECIES: sterol desaturase family protein [unclassified Rhodanobacter]KZC16932.1 fatty acid hydroxylase [Rhodanobacter sp. FW104-R8]KZC27281.1 fatty acid hydroxylase [Rhodanobacter sp. FW510-T8]KZC31718.1 fatty acid hydroxylase [Rhodanobacter sp. FW510-R10]
MFDLSLWWAHLVSWLSGHAVVPVLDALHLDGLTGNPEDIAAALLIAALQIAIIGFVFRPLETFFPAEKWADRKLTLVDRNYTLLMLLGIFPLFTYLVLMPFSHLFGGADPGATGTGSPLALKALVPWFNDHPYALFAVYYVVYDFTYYWMHRTQHALPWWWALHSMHHSTRQMNCWTNDRGSLVDGFIQSMILATVGLAIGVDPDEFAWLMLIGELVQNFSHTNTRVGFGRMFQRVFVDPRFHRLHHMLVDPERPGLHNCNFGQVLSVWDVLFGTALYGEPARPTGVGDPVVDADNNYGLVGLHWAALRRFWGAVRTLDGWKPGEVAFDPVSYRPIPVAQLDLHALAHHLPGGSAHPAPAGVAAGNAAIEEPTTA